MNKKIFRMLAGIILHPFKMLRSRNRDNALLLRKATMSTNYKKWERMHAMSSLTNTAFTSSDLYAQLRGALW